jgi:hypothetical protein
VKSKSALSLKTQQQDKEEVITNKTTAVIIIINKKNKQQECRNHRHDAFHQTRRINRSRQDWKDPPTSRSPPFKHRLTEEEVIDRQRSKNNKKESLTTPTPTISEKQEWLTTLQKKKSLTATKNKKKSIATQEVKTPTPLHQTTR